MGAGRADPGTSRARSGRLLECSLSGLDSTSAALHQLAAALCRDAEPGTEPPPGAIVGLMAGDQQCIEAYGDAVRVPGRIEPYAADTRTDVGSVTKIVASTAACLALVDAGRLQLDDQVAKIIGRTLPDRITVEDLLEHQAGLWEWWPLYLTAGDHDRALDLIGTLPQRYHRRSGRHYSDLGFLLLGAVIENLSGQRLDRACQELVFERFGLAATTFARPAPGAGVAASSTGDRIEQTMIASGAPYPVDGQVEDFSGWRRQVLIGEINDGNSFHAFGSVAGHAGVFSTAGDLLRYGRVLLDCLAGSGPVSAATVRRFFAPGVDPGQALGFRVWPTPDGPAIGHTGFPGVGFAVLPDHDAIAVMITNRLHVQGTPRNLEALWLTVLNALPDLLEAGQEPSPESTDPGTSGSRPS